MRQELRLLRAGLTGELEAFRKVLAETSDEAFQSLSSEGLGPYVFELSRRASASLPVTAEAQLKMDYLSQWDRAERMKTCLEALIELLAPEFEIIPLKGPIMAQRFFGSSLARVSQDIDFLVREEEADGVEARLLDAGYTSKTGSATIRRMSKRVMHHSTFIKGGFAHELHWALRRHPTYRIDYSGLWSRRVKVDFEGREYSTLSADYELVLQALAMIDDMERGCLKLKSLADIGAIALHLENVTEWDPFFSERENENILRPTVWSIAFTVESLEMTRSLPRLASTLAKLVERLELSVDAELPVGEMGRKRLGWSLREASALKNTAWWLRSLPVRSLSN